MSSFQWNVVILTFRQILERREEVGEGVRRVGRRERGGEVKGRLVWRKGSGRRKSG